MKISLFKNGMTQDDGNEILAGSRLRLRVGAPDDESCASTNASVQESDSPGCESVKVNERAAMNEADVGTRGSPHTRGYFASLYAVVITLTYFGLCVALTILSCIKDIVVFSVSRWGVCFTDLVEHWQTVWKVRLDFSHGLYILDGARI